MEIGTSPMQRILDTGFSIPSLFVSVLLLPQLAAQQRVEAVIRAYRATYEEWWASYRAAPKHERAAIHLKRPLPQTIFQQLFAIVDAAPASKDALAATSWILTRGEPKSKDQHRAFAVLLKHHTKSRIVAITCTRLGRLSTILTGKFLESVERRSPFQDVRAQACLHLAHLYKRQATMARYLKTADPALINRYVSAHDRETVDVMLAADPADFEERAKDRYRKVQNTPAYAKLRTSLETLGSIAKANLYELEHLGIGMTAPAIIGQDIYGKPMKLSDFRGKIVVLDFWGNWQPACRTMYSYHRSLVEEMKAKPFALVGVNSDADRKSIQQVCKDQSISWPSFWDSGSTTGPIASKWNVRSLPTEYILDEHGVIRFKHTRGIRIKFAVRELLEKMEEKKDKVPSPIPALAK
jgi:peroxiredoxin